MGNKKTKKLRKTLGTHNKLRSKGTGQTKRNQSSADTDKSTDTDSNKHKVKISDMDSDMDKVKNLGDASGLGHACPANSDLTRALIG